MKQLVSILLLVLMSFILPLQSRGQNKDAQLKQQWEDLKSKRAAYFTQRIGLTPSEAQAFWPVYDEYQNKKGELHNKMMSQFKALGTKKPDGKFEFDYAKANETLILQKFQEAKMEKVYFEKFKTILSPEKIFKYYAAERDWANKLLKEIENRGAK